MNKSANIHINLVLESVSQEKIKQLSYFMYMKYRYVNSFMYYKSLRKESEKLNISYYCLKYYIDFFLKDKWCYKDSNGNILFKKLTDIQQLLGMPVYKKSRGIYKLDFSLNNKPFDIQRLLESLIIKRNLKQQEFIINRKKVNIYLTNFSNNDHHLNSDQSKKLIKFYRKMKKDGVNITSMSGEELKQSIGLNEETFLSNENIGCLIKKSKSTASKRQKYYMQNNIFDISHKYKKVAKTSTEGLKYFCQVFNGYFFRSTNGNIFQQLPNRISLTTASNKLVS